MPVYEYVCDNCQKRFEVFSRSTASPGETSCPRCTGAVRPVFSSFASTDSGKLMLPAHGAGTGGDGSFASGAPGAPTVAGADLQALLKELEAELARKRRDVEGAESRLGDLSLEVRDLKLRGHALAAEIAQLTAERTKVMQELATARRELELHRNAPREDLVEAEHRRQEAEAHAAAISGSIHALEQRQQDLLTQVAGLEERRDRALADLRGVAEKPALDNLKSARDEADKLHQEIAILRQEREYLASLAPTLKDRAIADTARVSEDAAAALRKSLQAMRDEVEGLLQQALAISGRAALIESEVRSRAWLKPLADLVAGKLDMEAQQFRSLAQLVLEPLAAWLEARPDAAPMAVSEDFQHLRRDLQDWAKRHEAAANLPQPTFPTAFQGG